MAKTKSRKKLRLSKAERARRSRQAKKNFGKTIKRRTSRKYSMARKKLSVRRVKSVELDLMGMGAVIVGEPFIDQLTSKFGFGLPDDFVKVGAGWWLSRKGSKFRRSAGYTLMIIGARNLIRGGINLGVVKSSNNSGLF